MTDFINRSFVPEARRLPGATAILTFWSRKQDATLPEIWCQVAARFESQQDMALFVTALRASPLQARLLDAMQNFEGTISELEGEVGPSKQGEPIHPTQPAG